MGVHGLWRLVEPSGKPVPLETLENKVLAVDISLWLHQAVKGFQDSKGGPVPNAHLLGIYHRVCKLLYFKIKPVFIFDGGVPVLKQQTIAKRNQQKSKNLSEADRLQKQLLDVILKHSAISKVLSEKTKASLTLPLKKPSKHENMYVLPPSEHDSTISFSEEDSEDSELTDTSPIKQWDLHTIDMSSSYFKSLPVDVKHEILTDLKETRKQNSWGKLHELPKQSDDFSVYQMKRLLKRQAAQSALEEAEKEMGGHSLSLAELESILKDHGVAVANDIGKRIASDENTRYLLIKDVKQAIEIAKKEKLRLEAIQQEDSTVKQTQELTGGVEAKSKADLEFEENMQKAITLSLQEEPSTSKVDSVLTKEGRKNSDSFLENFNDADFLTDSSDDVEEVSIEETFSSALSYMTEYSGLTPNEIAKIINDKSKKPLKKSKAKKSFKERRKLNRIKLVSVSDESDDFVDVPMAEINEVSQKSKSRGSMLVPDKSIITQALVHGDRNVIIPDSYECNEIKCNAKQDISCKIVGTSVERDEIQIISNTSNPLCESKESAEVSLVASGISHNREVTESTEPVLIQGKSNDVSNTLVENSEIQNISCTSKSFYECNKAIEVSTDSKVSVGISEYAQQVLSGGPIETSTETKEEIQASFNTEKYSASDRSRRTSKVEIDVGTSALQPNKLKKASFSSVGSTKASENKEDITNMHVEVVEIMSDSGESDSSLEFLEVSESEQKKKSMEIIINPNQNIDLKDDLFHDIFNKKEDSSKEESLEIIIHPQSELDDNLFSDVFKQKLQGAESGINTGLHKKKSDVKGTVGISKQDVAINNSECITIAENKNKIDASPSAKSVEVKENVTTNKEIHESQKIGKAEKKVKINLDEMKVLENELLKEKKDLMVRKSIKERSATNITDQMYEEAQDLLELFGVPYIVAPMEAEAQCAFLDEIQLTDGTITDDSDIWLFGGKTVYKNVFHQGKYVMEFNAENIKHHFKLTREQMILLALLVGSDYTTGIQGIGPVTALEILAAFPPQLKEFTLSHTELISGLKEFRSWLRKGKTAGPGRSVLKNKLKNVSVTDNFPSAQVVQAYLEPTVDTSRETFSWSKPDFVGLADFAKQKFGWSTKKTEEILKPVIRRIDEKRVQKTIKDYFKTTYKIDSGVVVNQMSKRVKNAIDKIGKTPEQLIEEEMKALAKEKEKKKRSGNAEKNKKSHKGKNSAVVKQPRRDNQPKRITRNKRKETGSSASATADHSNNAVIEPSVSKKLKKTEALSVEDSSESTTTEANPDTVAEECDELVKYENIAIELKKRRQRRNELSKVDNIISKKPVKPPKKNLTETIPEDLQEDEEVQFLQAATSRSLKRVEEIDQEIKNELNQDTKKKCLPNVHKKEVIHQKLREKSDLLRNKLKAIEVFRKSKKGPGYVVKNKRQIKLPKEDAGLSENSSDE